MISFLLNNEPVRLDGCDPNLTVLEWLRTQRGRVGTKEGCASGDCGACTVVVAEADGDGLRYRSINSCITFVTSLHGKQLITVEDLAQGQTLHPVQQTMVDCHGSQCGFCTPGFVMSLFALRKTEAEPTRLQVEEALGGNLCRCTGYRPIIDAGVSPHSACEKDVFSEQAPQTRQALDALRDQAGDLESSEGRAFLPETLDQVADLLAEYPQARLVAGSTDLALEITQQLKHLDTLIHLNRVPALKQITETADTLRIGAAVTYADLEGPLCELYPSFRELLLRLGSMQIRNQGTLGGNIGNASPIGDTPPPLIAIGSTLVLYSKNGERRLPLEDYFKAYRQTDLQPGEFIAAVEIPKPSADLQFRVYKASKRIDDDISASCGAFALTLKNGVVQSIRIAFGGMAAIPQRAFACEKALIGQPWNEEALGRAQAALAEDYRPMSDVRASAAYRLRVSQNLLKRFYLETTEPDTATRVYHTPVEVRRHA